MDTACLQHALTEEEHNQFEKLGYLLIPRALPGEDVNALAGAAGEIFEREVGGGHDPGTPLIFHPFLYEGKQFRDLLDCPTTFPKIWGILGWNIAIYHCHLIVTPPERGEAVRYPTLTWHQDSGRVNAELDGGSPRPRLSMKCAWFLSDCSQEGMGNFCLVPGSHTQDTLERPDDGSPPEGAIQVCAEAGDALLFDRRIWHAASPNRSDVTRKIVTLGYGYRWIWRKDDTDLTPLQEGETPIRAQLLGAGSNQSRYGGTDVPLRAWLEEHACTEQVGLNP